MMFKIGDFSKICQVSIKALRHWDSETLLNPTYTDPETGYRYYDIKQLQDVNRIIAYKGLGLSLKEIRRLMRENLPVTEIRGMLKLKQAEIRQQIEENEAKLQLVEARLQQIERENKVPVDEATLKPVEPIQAMTIREQATNMKELVELIRMVDKERESYKQYKSSPLIAIFHDSAYQMEMIDVELGFEIEPNEPTINVSANGQTMFYRQIPAVELVASTVHKGSWITLAQGYGQLGKWISNNGYEIVGAGREIFHQIDWSEGENTITEIQFPVKRSN